MTYQETKFSHGDMVNVLDHQGQFLLLGRVVSVYRTDKGDRYDVQPGGVRSLKGRKTDIPERHLQHSTVTVSQIVKAYSGPKLPVMPRHISDTV